MRNTNKREERIGESRIMKCGRKCTIIDYRRREDIDVQFDDGTIVKNKNYSNYCIGNIAYPKNYKERIGEIRMMNKGEKCKIIAYHDCLNIDVQFEDGTIVKNKHYDDFVRGRILKVDKITKKTCQKRIGETRIMKNGKKCTIIKYHDSHNIDVQFEDGLVVKNKYYYDFAAGNIASRDYRALIGKTRVMKCGARCTIINSKSYKNFDIQFEDGVIIRNRDYDKFTKGKIAHPDLPKGMGRQSVFHNFEVKLISYADDTTYYRAKCKCCDLDDIMTPQQMIEHEKEKHFK